jgi:uncharacterized OsmC-like protein
MTATVVYQGNLRTRATHLRSGDSFITDAPVDNQGKGEAFSPTDLLATSLVACKLTTMAIAARNHNMGELQMDGSVNKIMADNPRRVAKLEVTVNVTGPALTDQQKRILEGAARGCPVARSLHPDVVLDVAFTWPK